MTEARRSDIVSDVAACEERFSFPVMVRQLMALKLPDQTVRFVAHPDGQY
jgi:hypothetical protein